MPRIPLCAIPAINAARRGGNAVALQHGDEVVTWGELDRRSTRRAWELKAAGVSHNDFVTLALPNGSAFYETSFAIWKLGATPHVVSWRLPKLELAAILDVARPKVLIASDAELCTAFGGLDPAAVTGQRDDPLPEVVSKHWKATSSGGSTGRPKIIVNHLPATTDPDAPVVGIPRDGIILNPGPLYHNAPFTMSHHALFRGSAVVGMAKFDPEDALRLIQENRIEWSFMVPTMMLRIWRLNEVARRQYDLSSLKEVWHGAAPMPAWLKEAWIEWLGPEKIWEMYGGTEGQGLTVISGTEWLKHRGSVGKQPANCEVRILDESGKNVAQGEIGEIYMRPATGPGSTYHYLGADARKADEGFESIGDFGWTDADGYLYLADRRTDMILSGGANVYPAEVEAALMEHPDVEVAVVVGLPHDDLGASVHAIVKRRSGARLDERALVTFVRERLALYKTPRTYEFTDDPLRDDAGKVRRSQLREERVENGHGTSLKAQHRS
jgi:bile acid-coenzyme A ligase